MSIVEQKRLALAEWLASLWCQTMAYVVPAAKLSGLSIFLLTSVIATSLFTYIVFYEAIVPEIEFNIPINFKYKTDCYLEPESRSESRRCSFPVGNVSLHRTSGILMLSPGQDYELLVELSVPESDVNYQIGNFLISIDVFGECRMGNKHKVFSESRNALLTYRSLLYSALRTLLMLPFFMSGYADQRQTIYATFDKHFIESLFSPSSHAVVTLHSRFLQFYGGSLHITAQLRGIKYALFQYPLFSGSVIVLSLFGLFGTVVIVSAAQRFYANDERSNEGNIPSRTPTISPSSTAPPSPVSTIRRSLSTSSLDNVLRRRSAASINDEADEQEQQVSSSS